MKNHQKTLNLTDFEILKCIGSGGFSKVFVVRLKINGQLYALKLI